MERPWAVIVTEWVICEKCFQCMADIFRSRLGGVNINSDANIISGFLEFWDVDEPEFTSRIIKPGDLPPCHPVRGCAIFDDALSAWEISSDGLCQSNYEISYPGREFICKACGKEATTYERVVPELCDDCIRLASTPDRLLTHLHRPQKPPLPISLFETSRQSLWCRLTGRLKIHQLGDLQMFLKNTSHDYSDSNTVTALNELYMVWESYERQKTGKVLQIMEESDVVTLEDVQSLKKQALKLRKQDIKKGIPAKVLNFKFTQGFFRDGR